MDNDMMMRGLSPYETFMISEKQGRRTNGVGITGLVLGSVGAAAAIGAWIFAPIYANSRAKAAQDIAAAQNAGTANLLNNVAGLLAAERQERVAGDLNITTTINDSVSGSQQGTIANQIENSAMAQATTQLLTQSLLGNLSENAQKVQIYSAPQPCGCPCGS